MSSKGTLLRRLQAIQTEPEEPLPPLTHYSLDELSKMIVSLGEKWKGSTFQQVWENDQGYINWFLGKYGDSPKMEHRLLRTFIECMVDHAELRGLTVPKTMPKKETHSVPLGASSSEAETEKKPLLKTAVKSKPAIRRTQPEIKEEMNAWDAAEWSDPTAELSIPVESYEHQQVAINNLHGRMTQMESVLSEVVMHLRQLTTDESHSTGHP